MSLTDIADNFWSPLPPIIVIFYVIGLEAIFEHECELGAALMTGLSNVGSIRILGPGDPKRRAGIVSFVIEGVNSLDFATMIDLKGKHKCFSIL